MNSAKMSRVSLGLISFINPNFKLVQILIVLKSDFVEYFKKIQQVSQEKNSSVIR